MSERVSESAADAQQSLSTGQFEHIMAGRSKVTFGMYYEAT